jgi:hypothetical protein
MTNKFKKIASYTVNTIFIIFFLYIIKIILFPPGDLSKRYCYSDKKVVYKGVITKIWSGNSGRVLDLNTRQTFLPRCQELIRNKVEVGDSLYKPKGTFDIYIYKKANPDSVVYIPCARDCSLYDKKDK